MGGVGPLVRGYLSTCTQEIIRIIYQKILRASFDGLHVLLFEQPLDDPPLLKDPCRYVLSGGPEGALCTEVQRKVNVTTTMDKRLVSRLRSGSIFMYPQQRSGIFERALCRLHAGGLSHIEFVRVGYPRATSTLRLYQYIYLYCGDVFSSRILGGVR